MALQSPDASMRVFFALWPDERLQQALGQVAKDMREICGGRAMRSDTIHMTMLFLGETESSRLESLKAAAAQVACPHFTLHLRRYGCWAHNHIGYVSPARPSVPLLSLVETLQRQVEEAGFRFDKRKFAAHVTVLRKIDRLVDPRSLAPLEWRVNEFVLMSSVPTEQGSRYQKLAAWPLR